jgi:cysteine desulfurase
MEVGAPVGVYLDHNATALPLVDATEAAVVALRDGLGNPSSVHGDGRRARAVVEEARRRVAEAIGATPSEVVFTSGATEALHLAVASLVPRGAHVVCTTVEHPAVYGALEMVGAGVTLVEVDAWGRVDVEALAAAVTAATALVVLIGAQNEIGNLYPVRSVVDAVSPCPVLCDAVQWFGKAPLSVEALGCAALALSGHKIGAPQGVGALWLRPGVPVQSTLRGGPQERGRRAGTENVSGIAGFGVAAAHVTARLLEMPRLSRLRDRLQRAVEQIPGCKVHGDPDNRLPNTLSFRFEGLEGDLILQALDLEGVCISSGSACSAGSVVPSPVLMALGLDARAARGGMRVSMGPETTTDDVEALMRFFPDVVARARMILGDERCG